MILFNVFSTASFRNCPRGTCAPVTMTVFPKSSSKKERAELVYAMVSCSQNRLANIRWICKAKTYQFHVELRSHRKPNNSLQYQQLVLSSPLMSCQESRAMGHTTDPFQERGKEARKGATWRHRWFVVPWYKIHGETVLPLE